MIFCTKYKPTFWYFEELFPITFWNDYRFNLSNFLFLCTSCIVMAVTDTFLYALNVKTIQIKNFNKVTNKISDDLLRTF